MDEVRDQVCNIVVWLRTRSPRSNLLRLASSNATLSTPVNPANKTRNLCIFLQKITTIRIQTRRTDSARRQRFCNRCKKIYVYIKPPLDSKIVFYNRRHAAQQGNTKVRKREEGIPPKFLRTFSTNRKGVARVTSTPRENETIFAKKPF